MAEKRIYIDTETGWQFSLGDLFLLAPLMGIACLAAVKFAHPSNPEVIFQAAVFVLPLLLAELLATFIAGRWILHSLRWLKDHDVRISNREVFALVAHSLLTAWVLAFVGVTLWFVLMMFGYVILGALLWGVGSEIVALLSTYCLTIANVLLASRLYYTLWRHARPRVWVPAEAPAHDG